METKICPVMQMPSGGQYLCLGERCAWYIRGRCAVADIADNLFGISMDTAVQEQ